MRTVNPVSYKLPDRDKWLESFAPKLALLQDHYRQLANSSPSVSWRLNHPMYDCPRENIGLQGVIPLKSYYFTEFVCANSPFVYDIGCGSNVFKLLYPNIIGVDVMNAKADILARFDSEWSATHKDFFPGAIAVNSLHFVPLSGLKRSLLEFVQIICQGGLGYITFNFDRIGERSNIPKEDYHLYADEVDQIIESVDVDVLHYENIMRIVPADYIDGNIALVFRKRG